MAENINTHEFISNIGGGKCLITLVNHDSVDIHREASCAISNILTNQVIIYLYRVR